jgi:hypothetical protein
MSYKEDLLTQALKHKGTDVAGWLQSAHTVIENQENHIADLNQKLSFLTQGATNENAKASRLIPTQKLDKRT